MQDRCKAIYLRTMSAAKAAPPILLQDNSPSFAEGARGWVIANEQRECGNLTCCAFRDARLPARALQARNDA